MGVEPSCVDFSVGVGGRLRFYGDEKLGWHSVMECVRPLVTRRDWYRTYVKGGFVRGGFVTNWTIVKGSKILSVLDSSGMRRRDP
jgi:hypothetical protein